MKRLLLLVAVLLGSPYVAANQGLPEVGFFELQINGRSNAQVSAVQVHDGWLWVAKRAVSDFALDETKLRNHDDPSLLGLCPVNECVQGFDLEQALLLVSLSNDYFKQQSLGLRRGVIDGRPSSDNRGVHLNYDITHADNDLGIYSSSALLQLNAYQGDWSFRHNHQWLDNAIQRGWQRLSTTLEYADAEALTIYSVGDNITQGANFNLPVGFLGFQVRSEYQLKPSLITYAQPRFETLLAQQSTAQLFVNGNLFAEQEAQPGLLQSGDIPSSAGRNDVQVRIVDAQGRERLVSAPFYVAPQILRQGLNSYSYQFGKLRSPSSTGDIRYEQLFASFYYLHGLSDSLNLGVFAEYTEDYSSLGAKWLTKLGRVGVWDAEWIVNRNSAGEFKYSGLVSYDFMTRHVLFNLNTRYRQQGFQQLGSFAENVRLETSLSVGVFAGAHWDFSLNLAEIEDHDRSQRSRWAVAVGNNFLRGGRVSLRFGESKNDHDLAEQKISLTLALPFGGKLRSQYFVGQNRRADSRRDAYQARVSYNDYRSNGQSRNAELAVSSFDEVDALTARVLARFEHIEAAATLLKDEVGMNYQANLAGSVIKLGGAPFTLSRKLRNSFLLVDSDLPGLPVTLQNRGRRQTNQRGLSLYDNLSSHQQFTLSLNTRELPITHAVREPQQQVAVGRGQGAYVKFAVEPVQAVQFGIRTEDGQPIKAGSLVEASTGETAVVSAGGEVYLEHHDRPLYFMVGTAEQNCRVFVPPAAPLQIVTDLGQLICVGDAPPVATVSGEAPVEAISLVYLADKNNAALSAGTLIYQADVLLGAVGLQGEIILPNRHLKTVLTYRNPLQGRTLAAAKVVASIGL